MKKKLLFAVILLGTFNLGTLTSFANEDNEYDIFETSFQSNCIKYEFKNYPPKTYKGMYLSKVVKKNNIYVGYYIYK